MAEIRNLTVCVACQRDYVYPVDWCEAGPTTWHVLLRCGNCGLRCGGTFDQATVEAFDAALDLAIDRMAEELARLENENFRLDIEHFHDALEADAILPEDF